MTEKRIEAYLREKVKLQGGKAYKFISPGNAGVPDRIIILPGNRISFAELKAPGKTPSANQLLQRGKLESLGCRVEVIDSKEKVDLFMEGVADEV